MINTILCKRSMTCLSSMASMLLVLTSIVTPTASAQHHPHGGTGQWHGDMGRFHEHDWQVWHGGHWTRGNHDGRLGWWWVVGPSWYFYTAPVYPYPSPWEPAEIIGTPMTVTPPMPPAQFWYYCDASKNYYPYVSQCPGGWKPMTAAPSSNGTAPMPQVP